MGSLTEQMRAANEIIDLDAYEYAVKNAVRKSVTELDPSAKITDTKYFNHSAVPDFVLSWGGRERHLYIRRSVAEIQAGRDVDHLAGAEPVLLAANFRPEDAEAAAALRSQITSEAGRGRGTLVATAVAVDDLTDTRELVDSPLVGLLGGQVLPSARGLLDAPQVAALRTPGSEDFRGALEQNFTQEALAGVQSLLDLTALAMAPEEPALLDGPPLSTGEVAQILPWLLRNAGVRSDDAFWAAVASRITLSTLQGASAALQGFDLTRLLRAGSSLWTAKRGFHTVPAEWAMDDEGSIREGWYLHDGMLTKQASNEAFWFRTSGKALQARDTLSSATWEVIAPRLQEFALLEVVLRGIDRGILLNGQRSNDVAGDASQIVSSIEDNYFVDRLRVRLGLVDEQREMSVEIGRSVVVNEGKSTIADLERALQRFVTYNRPLEEA